MTIFSRKQKGFTIVELLVVIVAIGILAAITIVSYGNWRYRTAQNEVKSDLNGATSAMESARNFGTGYPGAIPTSFTASTNVTLTYVSGDLTKYCLMGTSTADATVIYYVNPPTRSTPTTTVCT